MEPDIIHRLCCKYTLITVDDILSRFYVREHAYHLILFCIKSKLYIGKFSMPCVEMFRFIRIGI
jgi:hypothetical protein